MGQEKDTWLSWKRHLTLCTVFSTVLLQERGSLLENILSLPTSDRLEWARACSLCSNTIEHTCTHSPGQIPGIYTPPHPWPHSLGSINSASRDTDPQVKQQARSREQSSQAWWMTADRYPDTPDKPEPADSFLNNVVVPTHLTSILWDQWKAFRMTNNKFSPFQITNL